MSEFSPDQAERRKKMVFDGMSSRRSSTSSRRL